MESSESSTPGGAAQAAPTAAGAAGAAGAEVVPPSTAAPDATAAFPADHNWEVSRNATVRRIYEPRSRNTIVLGVYNFKGGVGKTTTTYTMSFALAAAGLRVMMVDADLQQSLSQFVLQPRLEAAGITLEHYRSTLPKSHTLSQTVADFKNSSSDPRMPTPFIRAPYAVEVASFAGGGELRLLMTDDRQSYVDDCASNAYKIVDECRLDCASVFFYAATHVIKMAATSWNTDVVIVDMSLAMTTFNRQLLMGCDFYIVPAFEDLFSENALRTLARRLAQDKSHETGFVACHKANVDLLKRIDESHLMRNDPAKCLGVYLTVQEGTAPKYRDSIERAAAALRESLGEHAFVSSSQTTSFILHKMPYYGKLKSLSMTTDLPLPLTDASVSAPAEDQELLGRIQDSGKQLARTLLQTLLEAVATRPRATIITSRLREALAKCSSDTPFDARTTAPVAAAVEARAAYVQAITSYFDKLFQQIGDEHVAMRSAEAAKYAAASVAATASASSSSSTPSAALPPKHDTKPVSLRPPPIRLVKRPAQQEVSREDESKRQRK